MSSVRTPATKKDIENAIKRIDKFLKSWNDLKSYLTIEMKDDDTGKGIADQFIATLVPTVQGIELARKKYSEGTYNPEEATQEEFENFYQLLDSLSEMFKAQINYKPTSLGWSRSQVEPNPSEKDLYGSITKFGQFAIDLDKKNKEDKSRVSTTERSNPEEQPGSQLSKPDCRIM